MFDEILALTLLRPVFDAPTCFSGGGVDLAAERMRRVLAVAGVE